MGLGLLWAVKAIKEMRLNDLRGSEGSTRPRKRIGRGPGSGKGKTAGRGHKGQKSRSGVAIKGFEGGQMPLYRRLPKRGFNSMNRNAYAVVNLDRLQWAVDQGKLDVDKPVDSVALVGAGLVRGTNDIVRLLGRGKLKAKLELHVAHASKTASAAVEEVGGSIKLIQKKSSTGADDEFKAKGKVKEEIGKRTTKKKKDVSENVKTDSEPDTDLEADT